MSYYSPIVAALVTLLSTAAILFSKFGNKVQDIPNERSLHSSPVPRIGGVGLMAGVLAGWVLVFTALNWWLLLPLLILFVVSLLDDIHGLPVRLRLPSHLIAAAILIWGSGVISSQGMLVALALLLLTVWMTNLYNFMDGSNGLAGGMALFGFGMYGIAALINRDDVFAMANLSISAAASCFLYYNFPKAKVFMGDGGSIPLDEHNNAIGMFPAALTHDEICARPWMGFYFPHPTWMGNIEWFRKYRYVEPAPYFCEDQELLLRSYRKSRFATVDEILFGYRVRGKTNWHKLGKTRRAVLNMQLRHFYCTKHWHFELLAIMTFAAKIAGDLTKRIGFGFHQRAKILKDEAAILHWNSVLDDLAMESKES